MVNHFRVRLPVTSVRDEQQAKDLMQQVLTVVIEQTRAGKIREPGQLGSYVLGTCRRVALDMKRVDRRRRALLEKFGTDGETVPPPQAEGPRLARCLEGLTARERAVVVMTFCGDADGPQIAGELEISAGNVRVLRHRAIERLQLCLGVEPGQ